ncbi:MAG: hypothetical protein JNM07_14225, partial [Phycisphaerae bacterium]|nr:hypothetical protein [Phycisphaerae bacterium]
MTTDLDRPILVPPGGDPQGHGVVVTGDETVAAQHVVEFDTRQHGLTPCRDLPLGAHPMPQTHRVQARLHLQFGVLGGRRQRFQL